MVDTPLQQLVDDHARRAGFARAGIAPLPRFGSEENAAHERYFAEWVERDRAGEMEWLKRRDALGRYVRSAVELAAPWARSIVVCLAPYGGGAPLSTDPAPAGTGWIARYANSSADGRPSDYHKVLLRRLEGLEASLKAELGEFRSWAYVDTGPLVERAFAAMAGMGWTGKNTCTLNQDLGSFFFLGVVLTSLEVAPERRAILAADRCGSCTRCIDACPTDALIAPRQMDASRCISYLTIEKRGAIDPELREGVGRQVFGCDICQDVCPWNARARREPAVIDRELRTRPELINPELLALAALTKAEWEAKFFGSPIKRARFEGFRRNLAIAMGNSGEPSMLPTLRQWAREGDPVLAETAGWAIRKLASAQ